MDLELMSIDKINEILRIKVLNDCDLKHYMICDTTYFNNHKISNKLRHTFWFLSKKVDRGDFIRLYTKVGVDTSFTNNSGTTTHVFYWDLKDKVWNNDGDCAVLIYTSAWDTLRVP